jgi:hypothetical protein
MSTLTALQDLGSWETKQVRRLIDALGNGVDASRRSELVDELGEILFGHYGELSPVKLRIVVVARELSFLEWEQRSYQLADWAEQAVAEREAELEAELEHLCACEVDDNDDAELDATFGGKHADAERYENNQERDEAPVMSHENRGRYIYVPFPEEEVAKKVQQVVNEVESDSDFWCHPGSSPGEIANRLCDLAAMLAKWAVIVKEKAVSWQHAHDEREQRM